MLTKKQIELVKATVPVLREHGVALTSVYMPGPGEDFGHILDNLNRYEEIL